MPHPPHLSEDLGEFLDIKNWADLCAELYKQWQICRRHVAVNPDRDYAQEKAEDRLKKRAQSYLVAAGISPYGLTMEGPR